MNFSAGRCRHVYWYAGSAKLNESKRVEIEYRLYNYLVVVRYCGEK